MRHALRLVPLLALAAIVAAGCGTKKTLLPDLPPETTLFVAGKLDTVNHVARLRWFGSDQDGHVVGFEFRFRRLDPPADSSWHFTTANDSNFTVWSPTGGALPVFEVRAVDDANQRDPSPASADFSFSNQPPVVKLIDAPAATDTTFPATTVTWKITDIDGDADKASYLLWLDGTAANPIVVNGAKTRTLPPSAFAEAGVFHTRRRTLYVQAIDDGGMPGNIDSTSWIVRAPAEGDSHAELLLLDDVATNDIVDLTLDSLYANAAVRKLLPGRFVRLNLKTSKAFRSADDLAYALSLFDAVAWTRGTTSPTRNPDYLVIYSQAVEDYVNGGGKLLLEGSYLVRTELISGTSGALDPSFVSRLVGMPLATHPVIGGELSYQWGMKANFPVRCGDAWYPPFPADSLFSFRVKPNGQVTAFAPADTSQVLLWALPGTMGDDPAEHPFAVSVRKGTSGQMVIIGCSLYAIDRSGIRSAPAILDRLFDQFGISVR